MPNNNYQKGANMERQVIKQALKDGAVCAIRGGGSKAWGKMKSDVWLLFPKNKTKDKQFGKLILVQCKRGKGNTTKEEKAFRKVKLPYLVEVDRWFLKSE